MISLKEARALADAASKSCFSERVECQPNCWTRERYFKEENCWLFLKPEELQIKPDSMAYSDVAFVVSGKGHVMTVADLHEEELALIAFLKKASEYLRIHNK